MSSVSELVFAGAERLSHGPHAERALRDAELLMMHVLGKDRAWILSHWHDEIDTNCSIPYRIVIERRRAGEPIQYVTGEAEFYGLPFRVTPDVLIPRPETEHAVEKVLELAAGFAAPRIPPPRIVDVGTGSGAIAVALASKLPRAALTAIDLSPAALAIARDNAERNAVAERIRFLEGDLLAPVGDRQFDIVVSNPPYVAEIDRGALSVEVREFEPAQALFAGDDGLAIYRRLIPQAFAVIASGGSIVLEIGCGQDAVVRELLAQAGFAAIGFTADLQGIPRVAFARRLA
jgi:release factor glutamine methyltransferase